MESDEAAWIAAARAGDVPAFERLVQRHAEPIYRIVAGHLGAGEAEDAAQEVFLRVHQGLAGFRGGCEFSTWVFRIATNVALTRAARRRRHPPAVTLAPGDAPPAPAAGPAETSARAERRQAVRAALAALPDAERAVAVLRGLEQLPFDEIARILGISRPAAESRMARARERLRTLLRPWIEGT